MPAHTGFGVSFSPIAGEETEEDLPLLLSRLFGGAQPGVGAARLPAPGVRGVKPDEILQAFLASRGGAPRPSLAQVLAPEAPAVVEQPGVPGVPGAPTPVAPPPAAPPIEAPVTPPAPPEGIEGLEPPSPVEPPPLEGPSEGDLESDLSGGGGVYAGPAVGGFPPTEPGTGAPVQPGDPDYGGPLVPTGGGSFGEPGAPTSPTSGPLTPEEEEFLNSVFGGGYGGGTPYAV